MLAIAENAARPTRASWEPWAVIIRSLWPWELDQFRRHLLRLDGVTRIERFGRGVSAEWLIAYCNETDFLRGAVLGCWVNGTLRGVGELRRCDAGWSSAAEAALSLEPDFQNHGLGSLLARRLLLVARNRGVAKLHVLSQASNLRMLQILRRHGAAMHYAGDQIAAEVTLPPANTATLAEEWLAESGARLGELSAPAAIRVAV